MVPATPIRVITSGSAESGHRTTTDVAANLAGDVNAAAEAYENLKRLLQRQLADPPRASLQSAPNLEVAKSPAALPSQTSPMVLPLAVPYAPVGPPVYPAGQEPSRLVIRGFLAGFAVSAAIGAALYICLAAG
jgi:hypothetical protein